MKVIDLLNKIANGEINGDTLIEFDNGYNDYCSVRVFFDRYVMDRENLNCEVKAIEEDKEIKKLQYSKLEVCPDLESLIEYVNESREEFREKINEIIDKANKGE